MFYVTFISEISFQFICTVRTKIGYCSCHYLCVTYFNVTAVADSDLEVRCSRSVHNAALYASVRPDLQIRICHFVLVWVLLWRGTEVNPVCGNIKANNFLLIMSLWNPCLKFDFWPIFCNCLFFFPNICITFETPYFISSNIWLNCGNRISEDAGFLIKDLPVPLICHRLFKKSVSFNTSFIYQGIVCNRLGEQNCQWNHYVKMYGETCL